MSGFPLPPSMCQTVTRVRISASGEDPYGNPIPGTPTTLAIADAQLEPTLGNPSNESNGANFDQITTTWRLQVPGGTDLVTTDRVQQGSLDLEVFGEAVTWTDAEGDPYIVECMLKRYGGGN